MESLTWKNGGLEKGVLEPWGEGYVKVMGTPRWEHKPTSLFPRGKNQNEKRTQS